MPRKLATPTQGDKNALNERIKALFFAGDTLADACRMAGGDYQAVKKRAQREGWHSQINEAKELASRYSLGVPKSQQIAFDRALTGRETRNSHSRAALKVAKFMEEQPAEILFGAASNFKAHVEAAAKISGDYEDSSANKFAVALSLNQLVTGGTIQAVPDGVQVVVED